MNELSKGSFSESLYKEAVRDRDELRLPAQWAKDFLESDWYKYRRETAVKRIAKVIARESPQDAVSQIRGIIDELEDPHHIMREYERLVERVQALVDAQGAQK